MNITVSLQTFKYSVFGKHIRYSLCAINSKYLKNVLINQHRQCNDSAVVRKPIHSSVFQAISKRVFITHRNTISAYRSAHYKSVFDIDTNVKTDVLLYRNNSWYFSILGYLAALQLSVWVYFAYNYIRYARLIPESENEVYIFNLIPLHDTKWMYGIPFTFVCTGVGIGAAMLLFSFKNIHKIILHKGGKSVYIETFGAFGLQLRRKFQLNELTCKMSRQSSKGYVPLKYKGIWFNLLIDKEGDFSDPHLFDMTAGLYRELDWLKSKK
ncbi:transmembrane protein 223 [Planococcus citri]|uniref:transmembrane protein 223 n=1 Tax=Planococcus citri TaxID=170843 RepID=UPI0031F9F9A5